MVKFPHQSPYAAFDNNPIFYNDPKGGVSKPYFLPILFKALTGAFVGGSSELVFQVADNMIFEGDGLDGAMGKVKWTDVGAEMVDGAISSVNPFTNYIGRKMSDLFTGKYRKMTMYIIKQSMETIEGTLNESIKKYLNGEEIDLQSTLTQVMGEQIIGEIISAKPFINKHFQRKSEKINKTINQAKVLKERVNKSKSLLENASDPASREKLQKHIAKLTKQQNGKQDKATKLLAKQYTRMVGGEVTEEILDRAKAKINGRIYEGVVSIGTPSGYVIKE